MLLSTNSKSIRFKKNFKNYKTFNSESLAKLNIWYAVYSNICTKEKWKLIYNAEKLIETY